MSQGVRRRRAWLCGTCSWRWASVAAAGLGVIAVAPAEAGQLPASAFQVYNPANASTIQPGPFALYTVPVDSLAPTQLNEGLTEVDKKATGFDILQPSQQETTASLLADIEPVVIGPGGKLYLTDGHHTFTALEDSAYGSSNLPVYVNIIANYSSDTMAQFWAQMEASDFLLPLNDGVPQIVNTATGSPIPTTLTGLTSDVYRGLEYSILKNKNSKLFTTIDNLSGVIGSTKPGLDKITGLYGDFIWADAYRNANGGLGLPYLSPSDIQIATQWNLNGASATSEPNIGAVTVAQLPGYILPAAGVTVSTSISNATLATGTLDGNGGFTGITQFNLGTPSNPIIVGTPQVGLVIQLGNDLGGSVTLSGSNTYTGGTYIIAGNLIASSGTGAPSDSALGAAPTETTLQFNNSLTLNTAGVPSNAVTAIQADNGIIFDSLTEGNGTVQIGATSSPGNGTNTPTNDFSTNRPIGVDGEVATINVNGYYVTLNGPLVSVGTADVALGNATGESDLTIDDFKSATHPGTLVLSTPSPDFYGNIIIGNNGTPTVVVTSDAALGATSYPGTTPLTGEPGQVELNGGTLQIGGSVLSQRTVFLGGGSSFDTNGYTGTTFGKLNDVQRTLTIENSSTTSAGAVTFSVLNAGATAILAMDAGTGTTGGKGTSVTFTNGITRTGNSDAGAPANATVFIDPATGSTLGSGGANGVEVFSSGASVALTDGIVPAWIITDSGGSASSNPYNFLTYNSSTGYGVATYTGTFGSGNVVKFSSSGSISTSQAYALNVQNGKTLTINPGNTLTIGDGTDAAGLILEGTTSITGGTLAFGASEAAIDVKSSNTISSAMTGSGGLTLSGSGQLILNGSAGGMSGPVVIDSGNLSLNTANFFPTAGNGTSIWLSNVKSKPSQAILSFNQSQTIAELNTDGNNSQIFIDSTGATVGGIVGGTTTALTVGDSSYQTVSAAIIQAGETGSSTTPAGTAVAGIITKVGTGVFDVSGGSIALVNGSTIAVDDGALRIGSGVFAATAGSNTNAIIVASGAELQYSGNGGSQLVNPIEGGGVFHLLGGTVQLLAGTNNYQNNGINASVANSYSGGTVIELGATLDVTTSSLTNGPISNAGGILVFDQAATGAFSGVMSDGQQAGGPNDPNDIACASSGIIGVACSGPKLSGTLIRDDSTTDGSNITTTNIGAVVSTYVNNNVTISAVQNYSGPTYVEAGALTLGAANAIETSSGVTLGRVGGGATAVLALAANNQIAGLADNPWQVGDPGSANKDYVLLNGNTLTISTATGTSWSFGGQIADGTTPGGNLTITGSGIEILTGNSGYTGATTINGGVLEVNGPTAELSTSSLTVNSGGTLTGDGNIDPPTMTVMSGGIFMPGTPGSPGTFMTVTGNLAFQSGAYYVVQLNSTTSTFANVTNTAALGGANVIAEFASGAYAAKQYTILETMNGLNGTTFGSLATQGLPSGFAASLSYNSDDVFLNLQAALGAGNGLSGNQANVANAINNYFNSGAPLPPNFLTIFGLSGAPLNNALTQLDGENATGAQKSAFQLMQDFLNLLSDPSGGGGSGTGNGASSFADADQAALPPDVALAYTRALHPKPQPDAQPQSFDQRWSAWGSGFGGSSTTNGNATAGSSDVTATDYGYAAGLTYHVVPGTEYGFALAGGGTNWNLAQSLGSGRSESFQAGVHGTTHFGAAYLTAALAFANHWFSTSRIALGDDLTAKFQGQSYAARGEVGYRYGVPVTGYIIGVTPYAAVQVQDFHTPSYSETDLTGGGLGLAYASMSATDTRSELGARFDNLTMLGDMPLVLRGRLAWAHDWVSNPALGAVFETLPGSSFTVNGAALPANSALTTAAAELHISANWTAIGKFEGEFGAGSQTYAGTGTLKYSW